MSTPSVSSPRLAPLFRFLLGALACVALDGVVASDVAAQEPAPQRVVEGEETVFRGTAPGPGAFYLVARSVDADTPRELRRTFVRRIVESVGREPF